MTTSSASASSNDDVTVRVKTVMGKHFSVERYYMLSEIEQQALLPVYLNDYIEDGTGGGGDVVSVNTEPTMASEIDDPQTVKLSPFIVLYLLWNCCSETGSETNSDTTHATSEEHDAKEKAESFKHGALETALCKLQGLSEKVVADAQDDENETKVLLPPLQNVYVIVDVLIGSESENDGDGDGDEATDNNTTDNGWRKERFQKNLAVVEALATTILRPHENESVQNRNRKNCNHEIRLCGATVGLADHPRAAPGLESCLQAIAVGARDRRRRFGGSSTDNSEHHTHVEKRRRKSCVGIVCHSLQDLVGYDEETETDAVQGVMQSLTHVSLAATTNDATNRIPPSPISPSSSSSTSSYRPPIVDFAHKAHRHWRVHMGGLPPDPTSEEMRADGEFGSGQKREVLLAMLVFLIAYWWNYDKK
jgi:hypothetical protein